MESLTKHADANRILGQPCDVTSNDQVQDLWNAAIKRFGRVDIWINNAGTTTIPLPLWEVPIEEMEAIPEIPVEEEATVMAPAIADADALPAGRTFVAEAILRWGRARSGATEG